MTYDAGEGEFAQEEVGRALKLSDLFQRECAGSVTALFAMGKWISS